MGIKPLLLNHLTGRKPGQDMGDAEIVPHGLSREAHVMNIVVKIHPVGRCESAQHSARRGSLTRNVDHPSDRGEPGVPAVTLEVNSSTRKGPAKMAAG